MTQFCDMPEWHLQMARSTDTSTHWSDPQLTSAFLPIKMAQDRLGQLRSH